MYRNYVFDLYGTLADIRTDEEKPVLCEKMSAIYAACGARYAPEELKQAFRDGIAGEVRTFGYADAEPDLSKIFAGLYEKKGVPCSTDQMRMTAVVFRALSRDFLCAYDGAEALLKALKERGRGVYLLSNAQRDFTRPEIEMLGLTPYFDGIFISSEQGCKKPSPLFFEKFLKTFTLDPKTCIMIGNDPDADIAGARRAGMHTLYICTEISPPGRGAVEADFCVPDGSLYRAAEYLLR